MPPVGQWLLLAALGAAAGADAPREVDLVLSIRPSLTELAQAVELGAKGVVVCVDDAAGLDASDLAPIRDACVERGIELWVGTRSLEQASSFVLPEAVGLALLPPAASRPAKRTRTFTALLAVKRQGDVLARSIGELKRSLGPGRKLAICTSLSEIEPQTARGAYVPMADLVRRGVVDVVCLSGAGQYNLHRLRLLRDTPLHAGLWVDGAAGVVGVVGGVGRAVLAADVNETCQCVWLTGTPIDEVARLVNDARRQHRQRQASRAAIARAIAAGTLVVDREMPAARRDNQATVHGVAQSWRPTRDGLCPLIQIFGALRGGGPPPPPLEVRICADDGGKPAAQALAVARIPAIEFAHESTYRWGSARFEPPVRLRAGVTYWIHLPDARHGRGNYLWGMAGDGTGEAGRAWSSRYDYAKHCWIYRAYLTQEAAK